MMQKKVGICTISLVITIFVDVIFALCLLVDVLSPNQLGGIHYGVLFLIPIVVPIFLLTFLLVKMFKTTALKNTGITIFVIILIFEIASALFYVSALDASVNELLNVDIIPFYVLALLNLAAPLLVACFFKKMNHPLRFNAMLAYAILLVIICISTAVTAYSIAKINAMDKLTTAEHVYYDDAELIERCFSLEIPQNAEFIENSKAYFAEGYKPCLKMKIKLDESNVDNVKKQLNDFFKSKNGSEMTSEEISLYFLAREDNCRSEYAYAAKVTSTFKKTIATNKTLVAMATILVDDAGNHFLCLLQQNGL